MEKVYIVMTYVHENSEIFSIHKTEIGANNSLNKQLKTQDPNKEYFPMGIKIINIRD